MDAATFMHVWIGALDADDPRDPADLAALARAEAAAAGVDLDNLDPSLGSLQDMIRDGLLHAVQPGRPG